MQASDASADKLRQQITDSLKTQGFRVEGNRILPPPNLSKTKLRALHSPAVQYRIERAEKGLRHQENRLLNMLASGAEVDPKRIKPRLGEVHPGSSEELLFRYVSLHWSIPVSSGYGRRLRFIVFDEQNEKIIGLFGLGDPVFSLRKRDEWIGWDWETRRQRLQYVMDAFVLGAVPPYSYLLGGKLVAMLVASNDVRRAFEAKYANRSSVIKERHLDGKLALITTTSALGKSSIYNRVKYDNRLLFESVGYTRGSGEFHFSDGLYNAILEYALRHCEPTAKQERWGTGFRNRREVVRKCLSALGLSTEWLYHGIRREIFVVPLARNTREFLRGDHSRLDWYDQSAEDIFSWFRERWLLPRAERDRRYQKFLPSSYSLWNGKGQDS